jgi:hypothetical protein
MNRKILHSFAELIDKLTINQIKIIKSSEENSDYLEEIVRISNDLNIIIESENLSLDSELIHSIIAISQLNLHIWNNKDEMQENLNNEDRYLKLLKQAHQLNGFRNKIKNNLLAFEGIKDKSQIRSNFETDGMNINLGL